MAVADYAEKDADMLTSTGSSHTAEHSFTRGWKPSSGADARRAIIEAELRAILTVTNPVTDRGKSEHTGLYDVVSSGWDPNYKGFVQTLKKRAPWDSGEVSESDDAFISRTQKQLFNQASVPSVAQSASGTVKHSSMQIDNVKQWAGVLLKETEKELTLPEKTISDTVFETATEQNLYGQSDVPACSYAVGIIKSLSIAYSKFKNWTVGIRKVTSKEVIYSTSFTPVAGGERETHYVAKNQRVLSLPSTPGAGFVLDLSGSPQKNPDGTWNWYAVVRPDSASMGVGGYHTGTKTTYAYRKTKMLDQDGNIYVIPSGDNKGKHEVWWQKAEVVERYGYQCFSSGAAAWAYSGNKPPSYAGYGRWIGHIQESEQRNWTWDTIADIVPAP